jgi:hypothetical protein
MLTAYLADGGGDRDSGELSQSVSAELSQSVHNLADGGGDRDSAEPAFAPHPLRLRPLLHARLSNPLPRSPARLRVCEYVCA